MPCLPDKVTSIGLDIGSVNCGLGVIDVWSSSTVLSERLAFCKGQLDVKGVGGCGRSVSGGIKATSGVRIEFIDSMIDILEPNVETGSIIGIEGFTNQPRSFTAFSVGEMGGYVRYWAYKSKAKHAIIIPPMFLNSLCGAGKRGLTHKQRKELISNYLQEHCELRGDNEHETDALGYAWIAGLVLLFREGHEQCIRYHLGRKIHIIEKLQDVKYWLK